MHQKIHFKNITGPFLITFKLFIHFTSLLIIFFCIFLNNYFLQIEIFFIELNSGNCLKDLNKIFVKLPSPGPSSTILKFFGFPNDSQQEIIQIAIISENKFVIFGEVMKSPFSPKGIREL